MPAASKLFSDAASSNDNNWLVVGDPPSQADELQNLPFTGEAADLLAKMLKAIQLDMGASDSDQRRQMPQQRQEHRCE
ncbi:MAG: hypothetical protein IPH40_04730 [Polaromonas sp.]|nr:hypothetical protein [Polaromonas sp.]